MRSPVTRRLIDRAATNRDVSMYVMSTLARCQRSGWDDQTSNQREVRIPRERALQVFVAKTGTNFLHHIEGSLIGVLRLIGPPQPAKEVTERELRLPVLRRVAERGREIAR